jgi:hypothetical protein
VTIIRVPAGARLDDQGNRLYTWTGRGQVEEFYSVTTIINRGIPKYLVPWAAKLVAELAYADVEKHGRRALKRWAKEGAAFLAAQREGGRPLKSVSEQPRDLALRYLKFEPERVRDAAADVGKAVHAASEDAVLSAVREGARLYATGVEWPKYDLPIAKRMDAFARFLDDYGPRFLATEATVYNRAEAYAGTLDAFLELPLEGIWSVLATDYKSGRSVYPEVALQTCAYAHGEFIGSPDRVTELPMPAVTGTAVLHLTDKGYLLRRLRFDDSVWRTFLYAREIFRWSLETSKTALGELVEQDLEDALVASVGRIG